jgi:predicted nucleic acid-binding protein
MTQLPRWLEVRSPAASNALQFIELDAGERDAILLASEMDADRLIIDDKDGRREAARRGIAVIGTLGVLRDAAALQLLDIREAIQRLQSTSFRVAPDILANLISEQF